MPKTKINRQVLKQEPANGCNLTDQQEANVLAFLTALGVPDAKGFGFASNVHRALNHKHRIEVKISGDFIYLRGASTYRQYGSGGGEKSTTRMMLYKDRVLCVMECGPDERGEWKTSTDGVLCVELPDTDPDADKVYGVGRIEWDRHLSGYKPTLRTFMDSAKDFDATALWMLRNPERAIEHADDMLADLVRADGPIPSLESLAMKLVNEIAACKQCATKSAESHRSQHMSEARRWAKRLKQGASSRAHLAKEKAKLDERRAAQVAAKQKKPLHTGTFETLRFIADEATTVNEASDAANAALTANKETK